MKTGFKTSSLLFWLLWIFVALCTIFLTRFIINTVFTETHFNTPEEMTNYFVPLPADTADVEISVIDNGDTTKVATKMTVADSTTLNGIKVKAYKTETTVDEIEDSAE